MTTAMPVRIAHLSDPHFGTVVPAVHDALLRALHAEPPDLILLTGDITQRARRSQFAEARTFLDALPAVPRLCLPGNHDLPLFNVVARMLNPYAGFRAHVAPLLAPEFADERIAVFCVDATSRLRHKDGVLSQGRIALTAADLAAAGTPFRIVATHQPLAAVVDSDRRNVVHGAARALNDWIAAGADLFLGGHIHLPYCVEVRTSDGQGSSVLLQAGTCLSRRVRGGIPNSYNVVTLLHGEGERRMHIERHDHDAASARFLVASTHEAVNRMNPLQDELNRWQLVQSGKP